MITKTEMSTFATPVVRTGQRVTRERSRGKGLTYSGIDDQVEIDIVCRARKVEENTVDSRTRHCRRSKEKLSWRPDGMSMVECCESERARGSIRLSPDLRDISQLHTLIARRERLTLNQ